MSRYYFHQRSGEQSFLDEEGGDFADLAAARRHAIAGLRSIIADSVLRGELAVADRIDIVSEHGQQLTRIDFPEAIAMSQADCAYLCSSSREEDR